MRSSRPKPYGGAELTEMFRYFQDFGCTFFLLVRIEAALPYPYYAGKDVKPSQAALAGPVHTFADYLKNCRLVHYSRRPTRAALNCLKNGLVGKRSIRQS